MNLQNTDWLAVLSGFGSKSMDKVGFFPFIGVMGMSLLAALFIAFLYVRFYKVRSTGSRIFRVFPLLGISITAIFITIQFSLPLSLGLLGALSIVRFRTPIKEPEEIGFIMLVVASSLCCATFNMLFLSIILITAIIALLLQRAGNRFLEMKENLGVVSLSMPSSVYKDNDAAVLSVLKDHLPNGRLDSIAEEEHEAVIMYNFAEKGEEDIITLQDAVKELNSEIKMNVFFNHLQLD